MSTEPILDVMRGISTVAAFTITFNQIRSVWAEIFTGTCQECRGAGCMICPKCTGTKTRRSRPAAVSVQAMGYVDRADFSHPCITCGPNTLNDFEDEVDDDEDRAWDIRDDMLLAMVGRPRKSEISVLAGTIPCPSCKGNPRYWRHTPNFVDFFNIDDNWWTKISQRQGRVYFGRQHRPRHVRRPLREYPGRPPPRIVHPYEQKPYEPSDDEERLFLEGLDAEENAREQEEEARQSGVMEMTGDESLTIDDFILNYVDDNDSDVD